MGSLAYSYIVRSGLAEKENNTIVIFFSPVTSIM